MSKASAPTPPNPIATAGAQTSTNVSTAVANAFLNDTNQITPLGSLSYDPTSTYSFSDPTTGQTFNIPRFTATQSLTPQEQAIQDQSQAAKYNLARFSNVQSANLASLLSNPLTAYGAPPAGDYLAPTSYLSDFPGFAANYGGPKFNFADTSGIQHGLSPYGAVQQSIQGGNLPITMDYGPADNFSADRSRVEEALYGRLNPQLALEQGHIEQQLADQGIRYGSAAYTNAMDSYNRQANDARLAVTQTAGQEQQRLVDMAAKRAGFQNAAQMQDFQEAQARGQFFNAAQQQTYAQALGAGQFYNQAQQQEYDQAQGRQAFYNQAQQSAFNQAATQSQFANQAATAQFAQNQARLAAQDHMRQQYLQEAFNLRNQPVNEISALLSGSQIAQPNFMQTPQSQIPTTDIAGLFNQNFSQQFGNYQQQVAQQNALLGGIFGAAGNIGAAATLGGLKYSDRRMKENVHRLGSVFVAEPQPVQEPDQAKLPVYSYSYKDDPASTRHIGPMAQDVERIDPGAVHEIGGRKAIDTRRVMGSILRAA